ncbi:hypothetical protein CNY89_13755 [Amaricoccus sp. HAR-UPW-R2A-40]|nr:hypothetical protein CNY89_13755 [Amaricoccus sp. HAR-UPW-R2A-40]
MVAPAWVAPNLAQRGAALPIFLLLQQVKLPKRLDLARDADRASDSQLDGRQGGLIAALRCLPVFPVRARSPLRPRGYPWIQ